MPSAPANPAMDARCFSMEAANPAADPGTTVCPDAASRCAMAASVNATLTSELPGKSCNGCALLLDGGGNPGRRSRHHCLSGRCQPLRDGGIGQRNFDI